ncbi:MAG TPA: hypothetical protein VGC57_05360 [Cellulomonas sp.]
MVYESIRARRAVGVTLAWLGCVGLAVSMARAMTWDGLETSAPAGSCVVSEISVGYDVDYDAVLGGYGITAASLSDVPVGCEGRELALTLRGSADQALAEARTAVSAPTTTVGFAPGLVAASDVTGVSVALVTDGT